MNQFQSLILSCEHGGNEIPEKYQPLFANAQEALQSHRGWDPGALELARVIQTYTGASLCFSVISRLFVELNRSVGHAQLFSHWMQNVGTLERTAILHEYYHPYREDVACAVGEELDFDKRVIHVSVHTFTPVLDGEVRNADIGLLYDPRRTAEREFCDQWYRHMQKEHPEWRIRRNYPYRGAADGLTTALRRFFQPVQYLGIELEVNQAWPLGDQQLWSQRQQEIAQSLEFVVDQGNR